MQLNVTLTDPLLLPRYAHTTDTGLDIFAAITKDVILKANNTILIPTGVCIELPRNVEATIRPRSGLAIKHGITVLNTPGTIDSGYRGEIKVILINHGNADFRITPKMRIAQLVISPIIRVTLNPVNQLSQSERGSSGFGSTGL